MKKILSLLTIFCQLSVCFSNQAQGFTRIKDIISYEGVRENSLLGYGLVVGLNGTGDKLNNISFTEKSLASYLERIGVNTKGTQLKTKNVAAVTVTATLPAFARQGSKIDVTISAMGDAKSLQGGVLLATPLLAADGEVYAVAQGALATGGFSASGESGGSVTKANPTTATISNGATVERETTFVLNDLDKVKMALRNPDVSTAKDIEGAINEKLRGQFAMAIDPATIELYVPESYRKNVLTLISEIDNLEIEPDQVAKIVVDENTGTIVMGDNVRIDKVAIAQGNLVIRVEENPFASQPSALSGDNADTATVKRTQVSIDDGNGAKMAVLERKASLEDVVSGLNALGVAPRDLITILQTIKSAGALQARIDVR